jgi:hypothetical protein
MYIRNKNKENLTWSISRVKWHEEPLPILAPLCSSQFSNKWSCRDYGVKGLDALPGLNMCGVSDAQQGNEDFTTSSLLRFLNVLSGYWQAMPNLRNHHRDLHQGRHLKASSSSCSMCSQLPPSNHLQAVLRGISSANDGAPTYNTAYFPYFPPMVQVAILFHSILQLTFAASSRVNRLHSNSKSHWPICK